MTARRARFGLRSISTTRRGHDLPENSPYYLEVTSVGSGSWSGNIMFAYRLIPGLIRIVTGQRTSRIDSFSRIHCRFAAAPPCHRRYRTDVRNCKGFADSSVTQT